MSAALLKVEDLKVAYGRIEAVRGIDLEVRSGEFIGIIGSNGAGKTSALRAIAGVVKPAAGRVMFNGEATTGLASYAVVSRGLAMVPEGRQVFADQTVEDNLLLGAYLRIGKDAAGIAEDIERVTGIFPLLRERLAQPAGSLSGGEQQMLAIARGLVARPKLMLVDEPTEGLSPIIVANLTEILRDINRRGTAILLVEQILEVALALSHRLYVMDQGRIQFEGTADQLRADPGIQQRFLGV
jgi:branched-chain amino acid transport system ATP-binding protein